MKKIATLLLCFIFPISITAQQLEANATTYSEESTIVLAPLLSIDADLYKNSILYDKVMPLANLRDINTIVETHTEHFKRAWKELYDARIEKTDKHISITEFKQIANHYQEQGVIPVAIMNIDFTQFKTNILQDLEESKTTINRLTNRNRTKTNSPYENRHLFLASPIVRGSIKTLANTPINFGLGTLGLDQSSQTISRLEVIYNNTVKTIMQNGRLIQPNFSFTFAKSGLKTLQFKAVFANGEQRISNAKINIEIQYRLSRNESHKIIATEKFQGYSEPRDCYGNCYGEGEYKVFLGKNSTKLSKPLIILDGFDPGDERKISQGENSILTLIDDDRNEPNMEKFKEAGFDVVILNFPNYPIGTKNKRVWDIFQKKYVNTTFEVYRDGGADYIERNANVLKALITELNEKLEDNGSIEKLKIIGPSMGGLISRVALTQMEKSNQNHNTDIWVSFDAPHLGANIPIGLQYFFNFMELDQIEMLKSPAARQMLLIQVVDQNYTTRKTFSGVLNSLGFPKKTRNVALTNGSINAARQGSPKGKMLDADLNVLQTIVGSLGRYKIKTFATHDGGKHKIFERYKRFLFFKSTSSAYLVDHSGKGSLDNSPGGTFDMKNQFEKTLGVNLPLTNSNSGDALNSLLNVTDKPAQFLVKFLVPLILEYLHSSIYLDLNQGAPTFIPTKSSLAFEGVNKLWDEDLSNRNLVCSEETPFDVYFAPNENQSHIKLNSQNMDWLIEELKGNEQLSTFYVTDNDLKGTLRICPGSTEVYSFSNCKLSGIPTWKVSNNLDIVWSNRTHVAVRPKSHIIQGQAIAEIVATTENQQVVKTIYIGNHTFKNVTEIPAASINHFSPIAAPGSYDTGLELHFLGDSDEIEKIEWQKVSTNFQWSQDNNAYGSDQRVIISMNCNDLIRFKVRVKNSCGWSNWQEVTHNTTNSTNNCSSSDNNTSDVNSTNFSIYPVPADTNLTVKLKNKPAGLLLNGETFMITLYSKANRITKKINGIANSINVDVSDLPAGLYILTVQYNSIYESYPILID